MNMEVINGRRFFIFSKSSRTQFVPQVDRRTELVLIGLKIFIFNIGENRERDDFFPLMGDMSLFCYRRQDILAICTQVQIMNKSVWVFFCLKKGGGECNVKQEAFLPAQH